MLFFPLFSVSIETSFARLMNKAPFHQRDISTLLCKERFLMGSFQQKFGVINSIAKHEHSMQVVFNKYVIFLGFTEKKSGLFAAHWERQI